MLAALAQIEQAKSAENMLASANQFNRISAAEPGEWLPVYYAAYTTMLAGFMTGKSDMDKAQGYFDRANELLTQAEKAATAPADKSEVAVLRAHILIGKVTEDPMTKGAELSAKVFEALASAEALNPGNPRAAYVQGMYTLNMPEFFGGGAKNARPLLEKAMNLYASEKDRGIAPSWGKNRAEGMLKSLENR